MWQKESRFQHRQPECSEEDTPASIRVSQSLQPLGKKKLDAALLATPLPRMTENAVVAQPASDAEKLELNKWIQERKASYPSTANLTAKQADADRCGGALSWLLATIQQAGVAL